MSDQDDHKTKKRWTGRRHYILAVLVSAFAGAHSIFPTKFTLDWPSVSLLAISLGLCFLPELAAIAPLIKSLKFGAAQIEMREQTDMLAESVAKTEASIPPHKVVEVAEAVKEEQYKRLQNTDIEAHIADLAAKDKQAALLRLSVELERELYVLHGELGLRNETKGLLSFRDLVAHIKRFGAINEETEQSLLEFRTVRNEIAHASSVGPSILNSAIDSGIRLLRLLRAVPRERYEVIDPAVALFSDSRCENPIAGQVGVLVETTSPDGTKRRQVFPAGRVFKTGEIVGWDWDTKTSYGPTFYHNPETGACSEAWTGSLAFVGKPHPT
jgi:hypothetical protein